MFVSTDIMVFLLYDIFPDEVLLKTIRDICSRYPLFHIVQQMISVSPQKRPSLPTITTMLRNLDEIEYKYDWHLIEDTKSTILKGTLPAYKRRRLRYDLEGR